MAKLQASTIHIKVTVTYGTKVRRYIGVMVTKILNYLFRMKVKIEVVK